MPKFVRQGDNTLVGNNTFTGSNSFSGTTTMTGPLVASGGVTLTGGNLSSTEVLTTTKAIASTESGKTFYLNLAGGFTVTLPAPVAGFNCRFIVKTAPTTAYIIVTASSANIMYGMMEERAGTAGVAGAARDTFNFVANQSIIGDWVQFHSDGTNWYYHGMVDVAAGNTVAQT